ncbi:MAG: glycosyltransferase family 2 protein [Clostridia bacterium]|nr:glycosyltransferase family 2 protein [Clostridia bacterium]
MDPLISVIVPVYRVEKCLHRCVDSILGQTYKNFELILVDDGSPDNCGILCDEYAQKDSRIRVIHRENGGLSAARNSGIEIAKGEYLTFIDSDDWVHPSFLELLVIPTLKERVGVSICGYIREGAFPDVNFKLKQVYYELMNAEDLLEKHFWNYNYAWGKIYRRTLFADVRYPEGKVFEDSFTTYKLLFQCDQVAYFDIPLYYYYVNGDGITKSPWTPRELVIFDAMREQLEFYNSNGHTRAYRKEHELYVNHFAYQCVRIQDNKEDLSANKKYLHEIRRELKHLLRQYRDIYTIRTMPYCYENAYPNFMRFYRLAGGIKRRIWKILHREEK